jgi:AAHS family 4-hydroxybenzoate transporter-like MFS transporter
MNQTTDAVRVDVEELLDNLPLRGLPLWVAIAMAMVLIADGFDIILLGYVAPAVAAEFNLASGGVGAVLTASLIGVAIGGFAGGYLGDRFGRRTLIIFSLLLFGLATLLSALAEGIAVFAAARFVAGLGLGAATPNSAALMAEMLPRKWRNQIITIAYALSTIGTTFAGILARQMLPTWGWRGLFIVGAVLPIAVCILCIPPIPESPKYLARKPDAGPRTASALNRLLGRNVFSGSERFDGGGTNQRTSIANLFTAEFRHDTSCLWASVFLTLFAWVALGNWGTIVITSLGYSLTDAVTIMVGYNLAGLAGAVGTALVLGHFGSRRLFAFFALVTAAASLAIALPLYLETAPLAAITGYLLIAGAGLTALLQTSYPLVASVYPTDFRATGIGSAFGFGRLGAVSSSAVTATLIGVGGAPLFFLGVAAASSGISVATLMLRRHILPAARTRPNDDASAAA